MPLFYGPPQDTGSVDVGSSITTTNATVTLVEEFFAPNDGSLKLTARWTATDGTNAFSGNVFAQVRVVSGIAALDSPASGEGFTRLSAGWNAGSPTTRPVVTFTVNGLDKFVRVNVRGKVGVNIVWQFAFDSIEVGT